jgi:hypothetical protein
VSRDGQRESGNILNDIAQKNHIYLIIHPFESNESRLDKQVHRPTLEQGKGRIKTRSSNSNQDSTKNFNQSSLLPNDNPPPTQSRFTQWAVVTTIHPKRNLQRLRSRSGQVNPRTFLYSSSYMAKHSTIIYVLTRFSSTGMVATNLNP